MRRDSIWFDRKVEGSLCPLRLYTNRRLKNSCGMVRLYVYTFAQDSLYPICSIQFQLVRFLSESLNRDLNYRTRASSPSTSRICSKIYLHLANRGLSDDRTGRYENGQPYQIFNTSRDLWELTSLEQCGNNLKFIRNFVRSASIPFFFSFLLAVSNENS